MIVNRVIGSAAVISYEMELLECTDSSTLLLSIDLPSAGVVVPRPQRAAACGVGAWSCPMRADHKGHPGDSNSRKRLASRRELVVDTSIPKPAIVRIALSMTADGCGVELQL